MKIAWGRFSQKSGKQLRAGWLITAGVIAIYIGAIEPMNQVRGISSSKEAGLAASSQWEPLSMWHQTRPSAMLQKGVVGGVPGRMIERESVPVDMAIVDALPVSPPPPIGSQDRKTIRNGLMDLVVKNPRDTSDKIRQLTERAGGFLVSSEIYGYQDASTASLQVRVPTTKFEEVRGEIRKLGLRVESEKLEAQDVTKQYVDEAARLRNLRAQEMQYLGILKQAKTVKDTLEVSERLNAVRGEIEQQQAEFDALSKQVETVALTISLRAAEEAQVFGLQWRPLYQLKLAARQGIDGVGEYAAAMAAFLCYLPTVLLWLATILISAALGWRVLRWAGRVLFATRVKPA
jgi:cell division protein FtsL